MGIRSILDDFLQQHHHHLSLLAVQGFRQNGRGAIPLHIHLLDSPVDSRAGSHANVRISVRQYRRTNTLPKLAFEPDFYTRSRSYNPNDTGLLIFQIDPGPISGYLEFNLASSARVYFASQKLPFNWSLIRRS